MVPVAYDNLVSFLNDNDIKVVWDNPRNHADVPESIKNPAGFFDEERKLLCVDPNHPCTFVHEVGHVLDFIHFTKTGDFLHKYLEGVDSVKNLYDSMYNDPQITARSKQFIEYASDDKEIFADSFAVWFNSEYDLEYVSNFKDKPVRHFGLDKNIGILVKPYLDSYLSILNNEDIDGLTKVDMNMIL